MTRHPMRNTVVAVVAAVSTVALVAGQFFGLYSTFWWYDIAMHLVGGVATASWLFLIFAFIGLRGRYHGFTVTFWSFLVGVAWEVVEFYYVGWAPDEITRWYLEDTALDLFAVVVGAVALLYVASKIKQYERTLLSAFLPR